MQPLLSPRQIARALDVSESSIKRWCDNGSIRTEYTAGGHRRVPVAGLIQFLQTTDHRLANPEALGIVASATVRKPDLQAATDRLLAALNAGDEEQARQIGVELLLSKVDVADICDAVFAPAMHRVGEGWESGEVSIYQERRSCGVVQRAIIGMQNLCPRPAKSVRLAIGASASSDLYAVPNAMAQLVLVANGWRACSLGENIPFSALAEAVEREQPRLVWVSCSHIPNESKFIREFKEFSQSVGDAASIVVGGRALTESLRKELRYTAFCDTMRHLQAFAAALVE